MHKETVLHDSANEILYSAIAEAKLDAVQLHPASKAISQVMLGEHLTYRYILITNLLAKATNPNVHALALQARADVNGAFDSRSLCHNVIVSADRDPQGFAGRLGRSNEPYLNKPARYQTLSNENAVRRGNDRRILETSISILAGLRNQEDAYRALVTAAYYTQQRAALVGQPTEISEDTSFFLALQQFAAELIMHSCEGECSALVAALSLDFLMKAQGRTCEIRIHPVNQAGSSSREVLDIDVYAEGELYLSAEVKDKNFTTNDVEHAARKAREAGLRRFFFIAGPFAGGYHRQMLDVIAAQGVIVSFVHVLDFFNVAIGTVAGGDLTVDEVWGFIDQCVASARMKDQTRRHILEVARRVGLITNE